MRILHLTTFLQGGAGLVISSLARAQRAQGHDVVVVTSRSEVPGYGNYPGHLTALEGAGVPFRRVDSLFVRDSVLNNEVLMWLRSDPTVAALSLDIIHTHAAVPSAIGLALVGARSSTAVVMQTMHGWGTAKSVADERHDIAVLNSLPRVIVPSVTSADLLKRLGVACFRLRVVPYGVDPRLEPTDRGANSSDTDLAEMNQERQRGRQVVCCIGTIGERKNQRLLIDALALLPVNLRPLAVFLGDGDVPGLMALAEARGVAPFVRCHGYQADARRFARAADWLVLPSTSEGLPLTILEAFADRVPVVASDIPELAEAITDNRNGLLFASNQVEALASRLRAALTMSSGGRQAISERAHAQYRARFQTRTMVATYMSQYMSLVARRAGQAVPACA